MAKIVVALGGNALSKDGKATAADQLAVANETASELVKLITAGHTLAIVHGNGPQIGNIILHEEAINTEKTPTMPVDVAGAMSQGQIGYWLQNALRNQLEQLKIKKPIASIVTQVLVSKDDPAFKNPSKPIGPFYTEEEAKKLAKTRGITVKEDAGRGWRKVVPSPMPLSIIESDLIKIAIGNGAVIVAGGGGGIPVYYDQHGRLTGLEAVIDKDFAAEKLAETIDADILLILTAVDNVKVNYKQPDEKTLTELTVDDAFKLIAQGQFAAGSMLPKVEAGVSFVSGANKRVCIITSPEKASKAIEGKAGTRIIAN
ncbi:carbamate kinase [Candidatus Nanosyncoccus nanoralicus]|uniref:Carbamate kinase n=1 Tax=Candidatus Nanosyncoccus nanoralicus TaxID=2171996 RepID=A0ABY0FL52_9BACT|nr:carbamate kinase [Candidatus Nanosyncoccus nanoralicus]RYC73213.1 Carbamate kinase 1 [Candidatus Nanosyncoccus nanoralicus]